MSKPKYMKGDCIRSLDDLVLQENIYWNGRIWNRKWFMNFQIQLLLSLIEHKALKYAVRRDGSTRGEFVEPVDKELAQALHDLIEAAMVCECQAAQIINGLKRKGLDLDAQKLETQNARLARLVRRMQEAKEEKRSG